MYIESDIICMTPSLDVQCVTAMTGTNLAFQGLDFGLSTASSGDMMVDGPCSQWLGIWVPKVFTSLLNDVYYFLVIHNDINISEEYAVVMD